MAQFPTGKWGNDVVLETPTELFRQLDDEFHFDVDVAANDDNHKCARYFTEKDDGLAQEWTGTVWCNPPYSRQIKAWVKKAAERENGVTVMLLPVRTDTAWWQDYIIGRAEVRYIRGRIKFNGRKQGATFANAVVIFRGTGTGRGWIPFEDVYGDPAYACYRCGTWFYLLDGYPLPMRYNYCPCCGANMDISEEDGYEYNGTDL